MANELVEATRCVVKADAAWVALMQIPSNPGDRQFNDRLDEAHNRREAAIEYLIRTIRKLDAAGGSDD